MVDVHSDQRENDRVDEHRLLNVYDGKVDP